MTQRGQGLAHGHPARGWEPALGLAPWPGALLTTPSRCQRITFTQQTAGLHVGLSRASVGLTWPHLPEIIPWEPDHTSQSQSCPPGTAGQGFWVQFMPLGWATSWGSGLVLPLCAGPSSVQGHFSYSARVYTQGAATWAALPCPGEGWAGALGS